MRIPSSEPAEPPPDVYANGVQQLGLPPQTAWRDYSVLTVEGRTSHRWDPKEQSVSLDLSRFLTTTPERGKATELVIDALREAIVTGYLAPGAWLREDEIAKQLGVSRTPVREAFRRLTEEQLVAKTVNQGTIVTGISYEDVRALYAVRAPLEGTVARFAAERRTDALVAELRRIDAEMTDANARGDVEVFVLGNHLFHRTLGEATGSVYLQRIMSQVENFVRRLPSTIQGSAERRKHVLKEHAAIIAAVDAGNPEAAEAAAVEHMRKVGEGRLNRF